VELSSAVERLTATVANMQQQLGIRMDALEVRVDAGFTRLEGQVSAIQSRLSVTYDLSGGIVGMGG
jgi:hypothetical protein